MAWSLTPQWYERPMKHIPLRTLPDEQTGPIDYAQVLREVVRRPLDPQKGVDITEMRQSLRVLDALDKADGTLELEDSDYSHLMTKMDAMRWNLVDRRILQLIDDVSGA